MWPDVFLVKRLKGQGDKEKVKESAFHLLWLQEKGDARSLDVGRYRGHRGSKKPKQSVTRGDICKRDNRGKLSNWRVLIRTSTPRRGSWGSYIPTVLKRGNRPEKCIEFMQNNVCITQRNEDSPAAWQWSQREWECQENRTPLMATQGHGRMNLPLHKWLAPPKRAGRTWCPLHAPSVQFESTGLCPVPQWV